MASPACCPCTESASGPCRPTRSHELPLQSGLQNCSRNFWQAKVSGLASLSADLDVAHSNAGVTCHTSERLPTPVAKNLSGAILALPLPGTPDFDRSSGLCASLPADATRTLLAADLSIMRAATEILESVAYKDEAFQELLAFPTSSSSATADQSLLDQMVEFVEHADLLPAWLPLAQEDAERAAAKGQQMQSRRQEDEEDDDEGEVLDVEKSVSTVKAEVARIVIAVSSNDRVMHAAFEAASESRIGASALLPRCTAWIGSGRTDLIITGSTMLANLARKGKSSCLRE